MRAHLQELMSERAALAGLKNITTYVGSILSFSAPFEGEPPSSPSIAHPPTFLPVVDPLAHKLLLCAKLLFPTPPSSLTQRHPALHGRLTPTQRIPHTLSLFVTLFPQ